MTLLNSKPRVDAAKIIGKHTYDKNHVYTKTAPQDFEVERPQFDADPNVPTYAGGDIPIRQSVDNTRVIPFNETFDKKTKGNTTSLDEQIAKQKAMIMGKFNN